MNRNKTNFAKKPFISLLWIYASVTQHEATVCSVVWLPLKLWSQCVIAALDIWFVSLSFETVVTYHRKSSSSIHHPRKVLWYGWLGKHKLVIGFLWSLSNNPPVVTPCRIKVGCDLPGKYRVALDSDHAEFGGHGRVQTSITFMLFSLPLLWCIPLTVNAQWQIILW